MEIPPAGVLFLYTDGLVERRGELLDVGIERVRSVVSAENPEVVCRRVTRALIGDRSPQDDVAMLRPCRPDGFTSELNACRCSCSSSGRCLICVGNAFRR